MPLPRSSNGWINQNIPRCDRNVIEKFRDFFRKDENPLSILPSFQGITLNYALSFTGVTVISHIPIMGNIKSRNLSISSVSTNMK